MQKAPIREFSEKQRRAFQRAQRIELLSIAYMLSVILLMYIVMGSSQAMRTAWIEDILGLIPPLMFLITGKLRTKKPSPNFPYGFHRVVSFGFIVSALSLFFMGFILTVDSLAKLIEHEHPTIGLKQFFGIDMWLGWWMMPVLLWGIIPPIFLGRLKVKLAKPIHEKILFTDGEMNRADWQTGLATIIGVLGAGCGLWWADSAAALFVAFGIVKDGFTQSKEALEELMNRSPTNLKGEYLDLPEKLRNALLNSDGVIAVNVRMYEHGHIIFTDIFIKHRHHSITKEQVQMLQRKAFDLDWRIKDVTITLDYEDEGGDETSNASP